MWALLYEVLAQVAFRRIRVLDSSCTSQPTEHITAPRTLLIEDRSTIIAALIGVDPLTTDKCAGLNGRDPPFDVYGRFRR